MICFKFLNTTITSDLGWENNTDAVVKKAQQRLYFLRQLKKFGLRREILVQFYRSALESILAFSVMRGSAASASAVGAGLIEW